MFCCASEIVLASQKRAGAYTILFCSFSYMLGMLRLASKFLTLAMYFSLQLFVCLENIQTLVCLAALHSFWWQIIVSDALQWKSFSCLHWLSVQCITIRMDESISQEVCMHLYLRNRATANVRLVLEFMGSYDCGEFFLFF